MWTAAITLASGETHNVSGTDRERVVNAALLYVDEAHQDDARRQLALGRWGWLPLLSSRRADAGGVTIVVTQGRP
jgi:hypothetical protein